MSADDRPDQHAAVLDAVRRDRSDYVKVAIVDIDGVLRGKYLDRSKFLSAVESGFGFCDVVFGWDLSDECYDNVTYTGWRTGYPDGSVRIDLSTHRQVPWESGRHFFLCDFVGSDPDQVVCPRRLLVRVLQLRRIARHPPRQGLP